jgi:basic membrane protein A
MRRLFLGLLATLGACALLVPGAGAPAQRQLRVGLVVEAGLAPSRTDLFALPYDAFIRAVKRLGVEGRVVQMAPNQDANGALSLLARQRYDLIIMGAPAPDAVVTVARDFPEVRFLFPDVPLRAISNPPKNVQGTSFRAEEAGYLAGYLAGLMEKRRPGRDVIGSVGGYKFPGVDRWILPFRQGARRADPRIVTLNTYANNFSNPAKCRTVALAQIAKGAGAVFNVAGGCGFGALAAAKEKGVWGVGVDIDQSFLGRHILTSAIIRVDLAVDTAIQRLVKGTFKTGGDTVFNLRNGGVGLGRVSPEVPPSVLRQVDSVRRQIIAGRIKVPTVS